MSADVTHRLYGDRTIASHDDADVDCNDTRGHASLSPTSASDGAAD